MPVFMDQYLLHEYLPALANTIVAELGVALLFGLWSVRQLSMVVLVNLISHPLLHVVLWAAYWWHSATPPWPVLLGLELAVVLVEGALLWRWLPLGARKSFGLSAAMNSISYLVGLAIAA